MVLESKAAGTHIDYGSIGNNNSGNCGNSESGGVSTGNGTGATGTVAVSIHDTQTTGQQHQQQDDNQTQASKPDQSMTQSHGMEFCPSYLQIPLNEVTQTSPRNHSFFATAENSGLI